jgi:hypothetical protein
VFCDYCMSFRRVSTLCLPTSIRVDFTKGARRSAGSDFVKRLRALELGGGSSLLKKVQQRAGL